MRKLVIKKCMHCNAQVKIIEDCNCENCGIKCCQEQMQELKPILVDKEIIYEINEDEMVIKVNHEMTKEHYIKWISLVSEDKEYTQILYPEQDALVRLPYIRNSIIYTYCNKNEFWKKEVK